MLRLMRSLIFVPSPFRRLRKTCGDDIAGKHFPY
jgi:hypothetical protein